MRSSRLSTLIVAAAAAGTLVLAGCSSDMSATESDDAASEEVVEEDPVEEDPVLAHASTTMPLAPTALGASRGLA